MIPKLLRAYFVEGAFVEIAFNVNVEKTRDPANRHRCPISLLDSAKVRQICPLHRLTCVVGWTRNIALIALGHFGEILQCADLICRFFSHADNFVSRPHVVELSAFSFLGLDEMINTVERNATIISNDAATAIGIRQASDDTRLPAAHNFRCIGVEHPIIMRFTVLGERLMYLRISLDARGLETGFDHPQSAEREISPV